VIKFSSPGSEDKGRRRIAAWLSDRLLALGDQWFAEDDQTAREHGWQITPRHCGLSRRYRDPRFGSLCSCRWCQGSGQAGDQDCPAGRGTGRLSCGRPASSRGGEDDDQEPFAEAQ
jgi:hypothetical protein